MAQKRIKMVQHDILNDRMRLLYDDGTQGMNVPNQKRQKRKPPINPDRLPGSRSRTLIGPSKPKNVGWKTPMVN